MDSHRRQHHLYSADTLQRINPSKDVLIGDHVWLGQDCLLLKGTWIASGSVIGGKAVVSGKAVLSNAVWAGDPARQIASGVFFHGGCVHNYDCEMTEKVQAFSLRKWIYSSRRGPGDSGLVGGVFRRRVAALHCAHRCPWWRGWSKTGSAIGGEPVTERVNLA